MRQEVDHRRHHDRVGNLLIGDDFTESLRAEPRQCNLAGAKGGCGENPREIRDMKDGSDMKINAPLPITHPIIEVMDIRKHIGLLQHYTLWPPGPAAGIR